jgi:hypothetical protein
VELDAALAGRSLLDLTVRGHLRVEDGKPVIDGHATRIPLLDGVAEEIRGGPRCARW